VAALVALAEVPGWEALLDCAEQPTHTNRNTNTNRLIRKYQKPFAESIELLIISRGMG
jgi:hypothetical protein